MDCATFWTRGCGVFDRLQCLDADGDQLVNLAWLDVGIGDAVGPAVTILIQDLFAKNIYATNITADHGYFGDLTASSTLTAGQELCVGLTCITESQLKALLSGSVLGASTVLLLVLALCGGFSYTLPPAKPLRTAGNRA